MKQGQIDKVALTFLCDLLASVKSYNQGFLGSNPEKGFGFFCPLSP